MLVAICYDISCNRRRRKAVKILEGFGKRVQRSVFECDINDQAYTRMRQLISDLVVEGDLVRYYRLCSGCRARVEYTGGLAPAEQKSYILIQENDR